MNLLTQLRSRFKSALQSFTDDPAPFVSMVCPSQDSRFGDYQANCAMPLAKQLKTNPRDLAAQIIARLDISDLCDEPDIAGPGFINLRVKDDWIQQQTQRLTSDERLGHEKTTSPKTFVIDYSAPNIAKPMHVGHLRSTVIGNALCRLLSFIGHKVTGDNHIGDWGTQFGMIIYGYKHFLEARNFEQDAVGELARLYRLVNQLINYHESLAQLPELRKSLADKLSALQAAGSEQDPDQKARKKVVRKLRAEGDSLRNKISAHETVIDAIERDSELSSLARLHQNIADDVRNEVAKLHTGRRGKPPALGLVCSPVVWKHWTRFTNGWISRSTWLWVKASTNRCCRRSSKIWCRKASPAKARGPCVCLSKADEHPLSFKKKIGPSTTRRPICDDQIPTAALQCRYAPICRRRETKRAFWIAFRCGPSLGF